MPTSSTPETFKDLLIGDEFFFCRRAETGLTYHDNQPGHHRYRKTSARKYDCLTDPRRSSRVGSIKARVWRVSR